MQTVWNLCDAAATKRRPAHLPVKLGLVASLSRPGGNATGINFFFHEVVAKRLRLLHDILPKAVRCAVLVNPANVESTKNTVQEVQQSAPGLNLQIQFLNAATPSEIDAAFAALAREHTRPDTDGRLLPMIKNMTEYAGGSDKISRADIEKLLSTIEKAVSNGSCLALAPQFVVTAIR